MGWAIGLSLLSAACYAGAAVVQERLAAGGHRGFGRWAGSVGLTLVGGGLHTIALTVGSVGVVQALGTVTLLFALPVAAVRARTRITPGAWRDAGLTVAGLTGIMALSRSPASSVELTGDAARYLLLATVFAVAALSLAAWQSSRPVIRSVLLAGAAGVAFGVSSVITKAVLDDLSVAGIAVVGVLAVTGYLLGQASYAGGGLAAPLAMVSVANPVVAATAGALVLGEGFRFGTVGTALAALCGVIAALGVTGLSRRTGITAATATASSSREFVHNGESMPVTGSSITASTTIRQPALAHGGPLTGSRTANTSQI
ncbi:DMT family transporter [Actinoplanes sp. NPDC051633]|uniref:DMT family transporter n=1 Tax=Actinoplanes sp. NPDC051633 TaxID=3155670 RepID=UPI00343B2A66